MQLSAANLLIASQQIARGVQPPPREVQAQFAAALAKEGSAEFEPMDFKKTGPERPQTPAATPHSTVFGQPGPLGANVDIRV
jgi:hypothetical protein